MKDKLKKFIEEEEENNEKLFEKSVFCREHNFNIEADVLYKEYEAVRKILRKLEMKLDGIL